MNIDNNMIIVEVPPRAKARGPQRDPGLLEGVIIYVYTHIYIYIYIYVHVYIYIYIYKERYITI